MPPSSTENEEQSKPIRCPCSSNTGPPLIPPQVGQSTSRTGHGNMTRSRPCGYPRKPGEADFESWLAVDTRSIPDFDTAKARFLAISSSSDCETGRVEVVPTAALLKVRIPLDSSDADICEAADRLALRCRDLFMRHPDWPQVRAAMEGICGYQGIKPPPPNTQDKPAGSRMTCPAWWRRQPTSKFSATATNAKPWPGMPTAARRAA